MFISCYFAGIFHTITSKRTVQIQHAWNRNEYTCKGTEQAPIHLAFCDTVIYFRKTLIFFFFMIHDLGAFPVIRLGMWYHHFLQQE